MKKSFFLLLILVGIFLISCKCHNCELPPNYNTISLGFQQTYQNDDFILKFDSVLNDSRCPSDGECFWAGNAEVKLIYVDRYFITERRIILNTLGGNNFRNDTTIGNINIKLVELSPYPVSIEAISQENYAAKILLTPIN